MMLMTRYGRKRGGGGGGLVLDEAVGMGRICELGGKRS